MLKPYVTYYKIGMELFYKEGIKAIYELAEKEVKLFLDLKLHDIPNTVAKACKVLTIPGIDIINIHTLGGQAMIERCVDAITNEAIKKNINKPKIVGVTILTSIDECEYNKIGFNKNIQNQVINLSYLAKNLGLDGVVCSPLEIKNIRSKFEEFLIITPGIRLEKSDDDQKRTLTPDEAIKLGADYIVIGRPILNSNNPIQTIKQITDYRSLK